MRTDMRFVRTTIARHAGRPASALRPDDNLEHDLDFTPLELVLIAIEIEEAAGVEIPVEGLASVETLAQLMRFYSRALSRVRRTFRSVASGESRQDAKAPRGGDLRNPILSWRLGTLAALPHARPPRRRACQSGGRSRKPSL